MARFIRTVFWKFKLFTTILSKNSKSSQTHHTRSDRRDQCETSTHNVMSTSWLIGVSSSNIIMHTISTPLIPRTLSLEFGVYYWLQPGRKFECNFHQLKHMERRLYLWTRWNDRRNTKRANWLKRKFNLQLLWHMHVLIHPTQWGLNINYETVAIISDLWPSPEWLMFSVHSLKMSALESWSGPLLLCLVAKK